MQSIDDDIEFIIENSYSIYEQDLRENIETKLDAECYVLGIKYSNYINVAILWETLTISYIDDVVELIMQADELDLEVINVERLKYIKEIVKAKRKYRNVDLKYLRGKNDVY